MVQLLGPRFGSVCQADTAPEGCSCSSPSEYVRCDATSFSILPRASLRSIPAQRVHSVYGVRFNKIRHLVPNNSESDIQCIGFAGIQMESHLNGYCLP